MPLVGPFDSSWGNRHVSEVAEENVNADRRVHRLLRHQPRERGLPGAYHFGCRVAVPTGVEDRDGAGIAAQLLWRLGFVAAAPLASPIPIRRYAVPFCVTKRGTSYWKFPVAK